MGISAEQLQDALQTSHGMFLVRHQGQIRAYLNACPHTGVNLEWREHDFMDYTGNYIQCSVHGAQFRPDSGLCIHGPCLNQHLQALPIEVENGQIYLSLPEPV